MNMWIRNSLSLVNVMSASLGDHIKEPQPHPGIMTPIAYLSANCSILPLSLMINLLLLQNNPEKTEFEVEISIYSLLSENANTQVKRVNVGPELLSPKPCILLHWLESHHDCVDPISYFLIVLAEARLALGQR